jgi:hypothetical protein
LRRRRHSLGHRYVTQSHQGPGTAKTESAKWSPTGNLTPGCDQSIAHRWPCRRRPQPSPPAGTTRGRGHGRTLPLSCPFVGPSAVPSYWAMSHSVVRYTEDLTTESDCKGLYAKPLGAATGHFSRISRPVAGPPNGYRLTWLPGGNGRPGYRSVGRVHHRKRLAYGRRSHGVLLLRRSRPQVNRTAASRAGRI